MARAFLLKLGYPVYGLDKLFPNTAPPTDANGDPAEPAVQLSLLKANEDLGDDLEFDFEEDERQDAADELEPA